ncbi:YobI family P-loop NTPase [Clostridium arbusti]|uniref:YobI family P-loop NTPase n=1 Tax=Clostridium arbusti TaxID=1137848 RepID=UPI000287E36D|nr:hypothetical protein [Clostridium arbusti]
MRKKGIYLKIIKVLEDFQCNIEKLKNNLRSKVNIEYIGIFYSDLMPKDEVDKVKTYHEALDWAIKYNSKIRNIALSGSYGAGKSTIIESYIKKSYIKKDKFLKISLANFDEKSEHENNQQLIEKSILEQMIYRVDGKKTPFSRFKKINKISKKTVWRILIIGLIFFISGWLLYNNITILNLQEIFVNHRSILQSFKDKWLTFIVSVIFSITSIMVLYYLINLVFKSFSIVKIKFNKIEIGIGENNKESIYNKYLDELLYFFEETQYEIVVFEDIDRFENPSIFTNLREINTFLYNYEKINRRIIFLYAIKDDIFSDKDRTKFFDFIIPVIPFVDAFNSRQVVLNKFNYIYDHSNIKKPSEKLIKDITIFLDDMRMLNNIINEYIIYYKQINNDKIDANKLFSIIVYKNFIPRDFSELQYDNGLVKTVFDKKGEIIEQEIKKLEEKIQNSKNLINLSDTMIANSIGELQAIFVYHWKKHGINNIYSNSNSDYYNQRQINVSDINTNIVVNKDEFDRKNSIAVNNRNQSFSYNEIFTAFGVYDDFFTMAKAIELKNKEKMQKEKEELNEYINKKNELRLITLKNLIEEYDTNEIFDDIKDKKLLIFLIRQGYIDETYRYYMSHFYPGAVTQEDMDFLRSVKNYNELGYDYRLNKVNEIIKDISANEFKSKSVLNNSLIDYLLGNLSTEKWRLNIIFQALIKDIDSKIDFIDQFCEKSEHKEIFIAEFCKMYTGFWNFIINKSKLATERIDDFFTWIISSCDVNVIIALNEKESIQSFIENTQYIFHMKYRDRDDVEKKLKTVFQKLSIKFHLLEPPKVEYSSDTEQELENKLIIYILENTMFQINESMIRYFYENLVNFDEEKIKVFESKNYSSIKMLGNESLSNYIESNLKEYLTEVFLKLPQNTEEDVSVIEEFLNSDKIDSDDIKIKIINKSNVIIKNFKKVPSNLWNTIVECNKWDITWFNIICYFEHFNELNDKIIEQLNQGDVYKMLSVIRIDKMEGINEFSKEVCEELYQYLYENENLSDNFLNKIQEDIPNYYSYSENSKISSKRMKLILDNNCIEISTNSFIYLKNNYDELYYNWSIKNFDKLLENSKEIPLEINNIKVYLDENKIRSENKLMLINSYKELVLKNFDDVELIKLIFELNKEEIIDKLDSSIFESLIHLDNYYKERVLLLANKVKDFSLEDIKKYLNTLGEPLNLLCEKSSQEGQDLKMEKSNSIKYLLEKLVSCNYIESFDETSKSYDVKFSVEEKI